MGWAPLPLSRRARGAIGLSVVAGIGISIGSATGLGRSPIAAPQPAVTAITTARVDRAELMRVVRTLASVDLQGRPTGSPGGLVARRFIRDAFHKMGLAPAAPDFLQPFTFTAPATPGVGVRAPSAQYTNAANVIAQAAGTEANSRAIVISAHYDHLGVRNGVVYPGADDNASGIAALLAIGRFVRQHPLKHRVILAAFDAEEFGLHGAKAFVKTPPVPISAMALNVNFDMVSRNDRREIYASGTFHTPSLARIVENVQRRSRVKVLLGHDRPRSSRSDPEDWTLQSDHGEFHKAGVPFLYFGVEDHPDYHKPTDTVDKIDQTFFGDVVEMLMDFVITADQQLR
jgi:hypothetical protein